MPKNKKTRDKKKKDKKKFILLKKPKKRNYNEMLEDSKTLNKDNNKTEFNISANSKSCKLKEGNDDSNNLIKINFNLDKLDLPPEDVIKEHDVNRKLNIPYYLIFKDIFSKDNYDDLLKKLKFNDDSLVTIEIGRDGNCLYRALSHFLTGSQIYHIKIRKIIYNYILENMDTIGAEYPFVYYQGNAVDIEDYVPFIEKNGEYGGELECQIFTKIFNVNIIIVKTNILNNKKDSEDLDENISNNDICYYSYYEYFGDFNKNEYIPLCILDYNQSIKHYEILYYNENFKGDILLNDEIIENTNKENNYNNNNFIKRDNTINLKDKLNKCNHKENSNIIAEKVTNNINLNIKNNLNLQNQLINKEIQNIMIKRIVQIIIQKIKMIIIIL